MWGVGAPIQVITRDVVRVVEVHSIKTAEDFWSFVDKSGDCWLWTGRTWKGRGLVFWEGKQMNAHRLAWILSHGIPVDGHSGSIRQMCGESLCVRPKHLCSGKIVEHRDQEHFWKLLKRVPNKQVGSDCWIWTRGHIDAHIAGVPLKDGYGTFKYMGEQWLTHRLAWFLTYGYVPKNMILHHCDTPSCCNPKHLFEGTDADNSKDMIKKGRAKWANGERITASKLTESKVREIRNKYPDKRVMELALEYGVSRATMYSVVTFQTWKHVT